MSEPAKRSPECKLQVVLSVLRGEGVCGGGRAPEYEHTLEASRGVVGFPDVRRGRTSS